MSSTNQLAELLETLEAAADRKRFNRREFFAPYPKQTDFFEMGAMKRERLLMAGNQLGKSEAGADEASYHMTGKYPADWKGKRFAKPTRGWIAGQTGLLVRDVQQKKLCGPPGVVSEQGTGFIPRADFIDKTLARGVTDAYDTIQVQHYGPDGKKDGISTATFKSYEQGRAKFQGEPVDWIWCDEEPPADVYSEIVTRTNATKGIVFMTFTPLLGMSDVVMRFLNEENPTRGVVTMTIDDAMHFTPEERAAVVAAYPPHEREARAKGIPMLGSGRIFQYSEESIAEDALTHVPAHWVKLWGIDFGIGHPFGAVLGLWDKDNDCIHIHAAIRVADQLPLQHAAAMKPIGGNVPVAWPQDGTAREKLSGETVAVGYKKHGLFMLPDHATWPDGGISTEAGILEMQERMSTGRFKVARHLSMWWEEFRLYHRKDGLIVKVNDDLMSATRIFVMMKRFARTVILGPQAKQVQRQTEARDIDFDLS